MPKSKRFLRFLLLSSLFTTLSCSTTPRPNTDLSALSYAPLPDTPDSTSMLVTVRLRLIDAATKVPYAYVDSIGKAVAERVHIKPDKSFRVLTYFNDPQYYEKLKEQKDRFEVIMPRTTLALDAAIYFTLLKNGDITNVTISNQSGSRQIPDELMRALRLALHKFPVPNSVQVDSIPLKLRLTAWSDSTDAHKRSIGTKWFSVSWLRLPVYEIDTQAQPRTRAALPVSTQNASTTGKMEKVMISYVIDENGKALQGSVDVLEGKPSPFVESIMKTVPQMDFQPARLKNGPLVAFNFYQTFGYGVGRVE